MKWRDQRFQQLNAVFSSHSRLVELGKCVILKPHSMKTPSSQEMRVTGNTNSQQQNVLCYNLSMQGVGRDCCN